MLNKEWNDREYVAKKFTDSKIYACALGKHESDKSPGTACLKLLLLDEKDGLLYCPLHGKEYA